LDSLKAYVSAGDPESKRSFFRIDVFEIEAWKKCGTPLGMGFIVSAEWGDYKTGDLR